MLAWWKHKQTYEPPRPIDEAWADGILTNAELITVNKRANAPEAKVVSFKFDHSKEKKISPMSIEEKSDHSLPVIVPSHVHAVQCETTKGPLRIALNMEWAPIGVQRVLDMVESGFFTDHPLYRAVDNFLVRDLVFVVCTLTAPRNLYRFNLVSPARLQYTVSGWVKTN